MPKGEWPAVMRQRRGNAFRRPCAPRTSRNTSACSAACRSISARRPTPRRPTDERLQPFDRANDPHLAALLFQFGRYLLISSSRPGTQPANLQGIWNDEHEPAVGLEVHDQHQHRDELLAGRGRQSRRVRGAAVPDDPRADRPGRPTSRASTTAPAAGSRTRTRTSGASRRRWTARAGARSRPAAPGSATHLWEHYQFTGDTAFLREYYPVMKGAAEFFLDFLVPHPQRAGW